VNKTLSFFLVLLLATSAASLAQPHPGGGGGGGGGGHPGGGGPPAGGGGHPGGGGPPAGGGGTMRAMPVQQRQAAPAEQGFNLNRDEAPAATQQRVAVPSGFRSTQPEARQRAPEPAYHAPENRAPAARTEGDRAQQNGQQRGASAYRRAPTTASATGGQYRGHFHGNPLRNGHVGSGAYGWNRGVRWQAASGYWGGGFWGPFALANLAGVALYGDIDDGQDQTSYSSYEVEPDSPGSELLADYGLSQTPCGDPNLVVIWGPNGSVVCAFPDGSVGPGEYEVDPSTFTLVPAS
jgi:hypothetical protein